MNSDELMFNHIHTQMKKSMAKHMENEKFEHQAAMCILQGRQVKQSNKSLEELGVTKNTTKNWPISNG